MQQVGANLYIQLVDDSVILERHKVNGEKRWVTVEKKLFLEVEEKEELLKSGGSHLTSVGKREWQISHQQFAGRVWVSFQRNDQNGHRIA